MYPKLPLRLIDENDFLRKNFQRFALLTKQEKEVLKRLALGQRNQQIGEMLFISEHTVRTHRNNIHRKLELHNSSINHVACYIKYVEAFNLWGGALLIMIEFPNFGVE